MEIGREERKIGSVKNKYGRREGEREGEGKVYVCV